MNLILFALLFSSSLNPDLFFQGVDRGDPRFECKIEVKNAKVSPPDLNSDLPQSEPDFKNLSAVIQTNYRHDDSQAPALEVKFQNLSPKKDFAIYSAQAEDGTIIRAIIPAGDLNFERLERVDVRWLHNDHYHTNSCIKLKRVIQPEPPQSKN